MACGSCNKNKAKSKTIQYGTTREKTMANKTIKVTSTVSDRIKQVKAEGSDKIDILKFSEKKAIYVVGHFRGCGSCKYVLVQLDKLINDENVNKCEFYFIEKEDCNTDKIKLIGNPTTVFVENNKVVQSIGGVIHNMKMFIDAFINGEELPAITKATAMTKNLELPNKKIEHVYTHKIIKIEKSKNMYNEYKKWLEDHNEMMKDVSNICQFIDNEGNLIVTFTIKPLPKTIDKDQKFIEFE